MLQNSVGVWSIVSTPWQTGSLGNTLYMCHFYKTFVGPMQIEQTVGFHFWTTMRDFEKSFNI